MNLVVRPHPHNFYFQILAENGIIGILFPILFFFYLTFILIKEFYERNFKKHKNLNDYMFFYFWEFFLIYGHLYHLDNFLIIGCQF